MMRMMKVSALMMTAMSIMVGCDGNYGYNIATVAGDTFIATIATAIGTAVSTIIFGTPAA